MTCHKCGKIFHIKKDCKSKGNDSGGKPPINYSNNLLEWVTKKTVASDIKDFATSTMNCSNKKYKWCTS